MNRGNRHKELTRLVPLLVQSPDLDPGEWRDHDMSSNTERKTRAKYRHNIISQVRGKERSTQRIPDVVPNHVSRPRVCPRRTIRVVKV